MDGLGERRWLPVKNLYNNDHVLKLMGEAYGRHALSHSRARDFDVDQLETVVWYGFQVSSMNLTIKEVVCYDLKWKGKLHVNQTRGCLSWLIAPPEVLRCSVRARAEHSCSRRTCAHAYFLFRVLSWFHALTRPMSIFFLQKGVEIPIVSASI